MRALGLASAAARVAVAAVAACAIVPAAAQAQVAPPVLQAFFSQEAATAGADVGLGFTVANPNAGLTMTNVDFSVALPAGLVISTPSELFTTCSGTVTAADGGTTISVSGATLQPADDEVTNSCTVVLDVVAPAPGTVNVVAGPATSAESGPGSSSNVASLLVLAPPGFAESFDDDTIVVGETARVTYTMSNPNAGARLYNLAFEDVLPAGLAVASPANAGATCVTDGIVAVPGAATIALAGLAIEAGSQCSVSVDVVGTGASVAPNPTGPLSFSYDAGGGDLRAVAAPGATATLVVRAPPALATAFGAASIAPGGSTTLTFTLANANPALALSGVGFTAALSGGLAVATPSGLTGSCPGGTITAAAGSGSIALAGAALPPSGACTFSAAVRGLAAGPQSLATSVVSSVEAGAGPAASASLLVAAPTLPLGLGPPPPPPVAPRLPSNRFKVTKFRLAQNGIARFDVTVPGAGSILVLGTLGSSGLRVRQPGPGRFTLARRTIKPKGAATLHVTLRPNAVGRAAIRRLRRAERVNVWVSYRPTGGRAGKAVVKSGVLRPR